MSIMANKDHGRCLVCDDVAIGMNFGVPTCMPCKAFFRRNAVRLGVQEFVCQNDGDCLISYKYRRSCNCCRLAKCIRVGMNKTLILSDRDREARNKLVEINRLKRGKVPKRQCAKWMQPPSLLQMATTSSNQYLSPSDQVMLANIFNAYESTCTVAKNNYSQIIPPCPHTSLHGYANELSYGFRSIIDYLKNVPQFANVNIDDKIRLLKNHFSIVVNINGPMMHSVASSNVIITWTNVFGIDFAQRLLKSTQLLQPYINDPILLKIVIIVLVLSSGSGRNLDYADIDQICDDPLLIFAAQNVYVDILWKYILSRSASEANAVKFFNKLMMCILFLKNLDMDLDVYVSNFTGEIKQMDPIIQTMWPRTAEVEVLTNINIAEDAVL